MPSIKVIHADEIRRVAIPDSFGDAVKALEASFGTGISLFWKDEDGDLISIKTDADMQEAFQAAATSVPRIILSRAGATAIEPEPEPEPVVPASPPQPEPTPEQMHPAPASKAPAPTSAAVHVGVLCDRSGMNPIVGTRWHMVGRDYDLCDAEFQKLPEEAKHSFEAIHTPGSAPVGVEPAAKEQAPASATTAAASDGPEQIVASILSGVDTSMIRDVFENVASNVQQHYAEATKRRGKVAAAAEAFKTKAKAKAHHASKTAAAATEGGGSPQRQHRRPMCGGGGGWRKHCGGSGWRKHCSGGGSGHGWRKRAVGLGAGELPEAPVAVGSFGPGVAQLQIALIKTGAMDESAIMWKQGVYGPRTAHAVATLQERYQLDGQRGMMDEQVAKVLADKLAGTFVEPTPAPTPAPTSAEVAEEGSAVEETACWPIVVKVGSSEHENVKVVELPGVGFTVSPVPANEQAADWNDQFEVTVDGSQLTVRRIDADGGWGQELELVANQGEGMADDVVQFEEAHLFQRDQDQGQVEEPEPTPEPAAAPAREERWGDKLEQLAQMGFLNTAVLTPLLDRHSGSIISVVAELLGQ